MGGAMAQCPSPQYATVYNVKSMQKNASNRHLTKHNHNKRSICCPPRKCFAQGPWLKNPDLDIGKKIKSTLFSYRWALLFMNHIYSNKEIV